MHRFLATCPACAVRVLLGTQTLRLVTPADPGRATRAIFTCPACAQRESVQLEGDVAAALQASGVPVSHGHPCLGPPAPPPTGPPITHDDLLDFHLLLAQPDWFDRVLEAADGSTDVTDETSDGLRAARGRG